MVRYQFWEDVGIHFVTALEPFRLRELYELGFANLRKGGKPSELWRPTLFDFRAVDMSRIKESDIRRLLIRRKAFGAKYDNSATAYLVKDMRSFGKVRLTTIFAELTHLRDESQTIVTTEVPEIVNWLASKLAVDNAQSNAMTLRIG